ncbi:MAG: glycosyltransferase family 4 protein [Candidatus Shapirobacteria bacterium]|jgi:glycosyltransferase involved in cell wall biosynthesis
MKRILVGITYYYPNISGVSVYAKILAEELGKLNSLGVISGRFKRELKKEEIINGVKILRVDGWQIGKGFLMWEYPKESFKAVKNYDIINCHLPSMESFWLALWGKILRKKIIITHHCEFGFNGKLSNKIIAILSFPSHFFTYLWADKIVAYTKDYADNSMFLKIFKNKLVYILPPIKIENRDKKLDFRKKNKEKIVGFVGRIGWEKGLTYLIEAMKNMDAKLILAGPYKEVIGDKTYEIISAKGGKNIEFIGPIEHENLNNFYEMIDCLVLPSVNNLETFGIVQVEAMKCGTPVVASNLPGVRVPVQMTGMGEICEIKNAGDLAKKINLVLKNGKKYYQQKAKNLELFNYKKTVEEYKKLFESVEKGNVGMDRIRR